MTVSESPMDDRLCEQAVEHLSHLTVTIRDRSVGSAGNRAATDYVEKAFAENKWATERQSFDAMDWSDGSATLTAADGSAFEVFASPYANGCKVHARLVAVSTVDDLEAVDASRSLLLLHGEIAGDALLPKNFPFYRLEDHQRIIALLEASDAAAVLCATAHDNVMAGGVDPTPMIEDGDFDIPSVFMAEQEGERLARLTDQRFTLISESQRVPSRAVNVVGRINGGARRRIVVTAHIDAKKGVPGALDNGTGVATLLLLSDLLADYSGAFCLELVALNGEDHYAVPGQIAFMEANRDRFDTIALNINIDGVGYVEGETAFSPFDLPAEMTAQAERELFDQPGSCRGIPWPQGDHSMFVQAGCPAIAVTSNWLLDNMVTQTITHTRSDSMERVAPPKVMSCALSLKRFIEILS